MVGAVVLGDELAVDGERAEVVEDPLERLAVLPERRPAVLGDELRGDQRAQRGLHACMERLTHHGLERFL